MDLKEMYCERAEEIAGEVYGKEFTRLTPELQDKVWRMAERGVVENCYDHADFLRKSKRSER
ncbi:MAG: hypothetical protein U9O94_01560 [Nanoarchaeota archaeon]|nr:hypothetical protein [Nanoarchaeota archaeon]